MDQLCAQCQTALLPSATWTHADACLDGEPLWSLCQGDAFAHLGRLPGQSVDAVITDPPYGAGFSMAERMRSSKEKYINSDSSYAKPLPNMAGDAVMAEHWRTVMDALLAQSVRLLRPGGHFLAFIDWRGLPSLTAAVMASGLRPRGVVVWDKGRGSRPYKGGFRMQSELIVWASAGTLKPWEGQPYLDGVLSHTTPTRGKLHITQKPLTLMEELIQVVPRGGVIVDPFAGSATTGVAAVRHGRRFIGYELVPEYYETGLERLREAEVGHEPV